jgi:hypothetical protein
MTHNWPILRRLSALALVLVLAGCDRVPRGLEPDKSFRSPGDADGGSGADAGPKVSRSNAQHRGSRRVGRQGRSHPMAGVKLVVVPADPASGLKAIPDSGL